MNQDGYDVAVIGLGYVGLPLAIAFAESGKRVLGIDTDKTKCERIANGQSYIKHVQPELISRLVKSQSLKATTNFSLSQFSRSIVICVPTPLTKNRMPDLSFVERTAELISPHLKSGQLVVLESTTYPGTTEEVLIPALENSNSLVAGKDFHVAYSPEREDPGNPKSKLNAMPKVIGGLTTSCLEKAKQLYLSVVGEVIEVSSCKAAEATKLMENIFRSVNIALVNELKVVFAAMGIDIWDVIEAASTKPFGYMPFYPGPGLGGHCIPIDPFYLTWKAFEYKKHTRLIELSGEINTAMPEYVVSRVIDALNEDGKSVKGARILLLGIAYKPNVDDDRESPSYEIMSLLSKRGAQIAYNDPHVPEIKLGRCSKEFAGSRSEEITASYDVMVLCTQHLEYVDFDFSKIGVPLVDSRNCVQKKPSKYFKA